MTVALPAFSGYAGFMNPVNEYLASVPSGTLNTAFLAYLCNLTETARVAPEIAASVVHELENQRRRIKLIASENYCSMPVQLTMGNLFTDKYAEGVPYHRFYAGKVFTGDYDPVLHAHVVTTKH